jgi:hypothetical protein
MLRAAGRACDAPPEDIHTDSLYARNVTLGVWRGKRRRHELMIQHLRRLWMQIQAKRGRGTIRILHVRSHIDIPGNELADRMAGAAMRNANAVANAKPGQMPTLERIDLDWARAQMRAMTGSSRLQPRRWHMFGRLRAESTKVQLYRARLTLARAACTSSRPRRSTGFPMCPVGSMPSPFW